MRAALSLFVVLLIPACGGNPAAPDVQAPMIDGAFTFSWTGSDIGFNQCGDRTAPQVGTNVWHAAQGTHDSSGTWIGRPRTAADGNFEIRLRVADASNLPPGGPRPTQTPVTGTITGTAADSLVIIPPPSGRVASFGESTAISGWIWLGSVLGEGSGTGTIGFTANGRTVTCPGVGWLMNGPH